MTLEEARDELAAALASAAREHGVPNTFSPQWLEYFSGAPLRMLSGRIGRHYSRALNDALRPHGFATTYDTRRRVFVVDRALA